MGKYAKISFSNIPKVGPKFQNISVPIPIPAVPIGVTFTARSFGRSVKLDLVRSIERAITVGTENVGLQLEKKLDESMQSSGWGWTEGTRDIVDTGKLMNSVKIDVSARGISVNYDEPYAAIVHYGGYIQPYGDSTRRPVYIPGRPWISSLLDGEGPVQPIDYEQAYYKALVDNVQSIY